MLVLPSYGFARSVKTHNVRLDVFCDWVLASIFFSEDNELSTTDIVDTLVDGEIYREQDFAREMIANGWSELERRQKWMGNGSPFEVIDSMIKRRCSWDESIAHSFLLALTCAKWYPKWAEKFGTDYTKQGSIFEQLTAEALQFLFPDWQIHVTGWSRSQPNKLAKIVDDVAARVCEPTGNVRAWTTKNANEAGLDILCYKPFSDGRCGAPVYLMQCASEKDYLEKVNTPDLKIWTKIVLFTCAPQKAFATPFAFEDEEFKQVYNRVDGLLLDRSRLLSPGILKSDWVSPDLKRKIKKWLGPRVKELPEDNQ